eukprot:gene8662-6230_t
MISDGSELLLLVPAWAGLVGSVVLPVLGAVPDGCMVLFSGLGPNAQEQLSVGVGALAGSTIMVLIIPWFLSVVGGRVNIDPKTGRPNYKAPKLNPPNYFHLTETGVVISPEVNKTAYMVLATSVSYLLLQVPGLIYLNDTPAQQAKGERYWALLGLIVCVSLFSYYLYQQYVKSDEEDTTQQDSRDEYLRTAIAQKKITLAGVMTLEMEKYEEEERNGGQRSSSQNSYQEGKTAEMAPLRGMHNRQKSTIGEISERFIDHLKRILRPFFVSYDAGNAGSLKTQDLLAVFRDMGEHLTSEQLEAIFLIAAYNYSLKKTPTSITVSLTTLEGAAIMNNTFVLGVFMALVYFKGLVWEYFAETTAILIVELIMIYFAMFKTKHTIFDAYLILSMYPLSLAFVAFLEYIGWN